MPIRVALADDHQILVDGLRRLIDATPDMRVVATANDAPSALAAVQRELPDVLVLDLSMPAGGGLEVARRVREIGLATKIVVLTMWAQERYVLEAVRLHNHAVPAKGSEAGVAGFKHIYAGLCQQKLKVP